MTDVVPTKITPQQVINNKENLDVYAEDTMIDGFKKFIARGQMIDMAVGVVMGGAVTTIINAIVASFINPLIAMIFGKPNMDKMLAFTVNGATISFGAILGALLNFLMIAVAVYFFIVMPINKFRDFSKKRSQEKTDAGESADEEISTEDQTIQLLTQIRDELTASNGRSTAVEGVLAEQDKKLG